MSSSSQFTWGDFVVFGVTIAVSFTIGIMASFYGKKKGTIMNYLMGNRSLSVFPVAMSLLATGVTSVDMLGVTAEMYFFGTQYIMEILGVILAYPIPVLLVVPLLYPLKLKSIFQVS